MALGASIDQVSPLAYLLAFGGGISSFVSPCTLPLLPGYLSMVTGVDVASLEQDPKAHTRRIVSTTLLFTLGLGLVFVPLGFTSSAVGGFLFRNQEVLTRVSGVIVLAMAGFLAASAFSNAMWLQREYKAHPELRRFGRAAPMVAGMAFAFGWTPCIGPIYGSILGIAATQGQGFAGASLLAVYTLGIGLPFLACGLLLGRMGGALRFVRRHNRTIVLASAAVLGLFGVLLVLDELTWVTRELTKVYEALGLDRLIENVA